MADNGAHAEAVLVSGSWIFNYIWFVIAKLLCIFYSHKVWDLPSLWCLKISMCWHWQV